MFVLDISNQMPKLFQPKSAENFAEKMKKFQIQNVKNSFRPNQKETEKDHIYNKLRSY